jgi:hypothetical protein
MGFPSYKTQRYWQQQTEARNNRSAAELTKPTKADLRREIEQAAANTARQQQSSNEEKANEPAHH